MTEEAWAEAKRIQEIRGGDYRKFRQTYREDIVAFAHDVVNWPKDTGITEYQAEALDSLYRFKRVAVRGPHGLGKCLDADEEIPLSTGELRRVGDLVGSRAPVITVDENLRRSARYAYFTDNGKKPVYRITTASGRTVVRTAEHPLLACRNPQRQGRGASRKRVEREWIQVQDLRPGMCLVAVLREEGEGTDLQDNAIKVMAHMATSRQLPVSYGSSYENLQYEPALEEMFREIDSMGKRAPIQEWWTNLSVQHMSQRLPDVVWTFEEDHVFLFLSRLYSRIGTLKSYQKKHPTLKKYQRLIHYDTPYLSFAQDLQRLLARVGVWSRIGLTKGGGKYRVIVEQSRSFWRLVDNAPFYGEDDQLAEMYETRKGFSFGGPQIWRWNGLPHMGYQWDPIESVEFVEMRPTVCVSVPGPETFLTDFVEHNSAMASLVVMHFALTRDIDHDWKVVTTASVWRQLTKYLWPEIHKWSRMMKWEKIGRPAFRRNRELMSMSLRLETGEAFAAACEDPTAIEGAHADELLYIFDESKAIPDPTWDAAEGAFSGDGARQKAYALAISTPGEPQGRFYQIHKREPGYEDWHPIHVTVDRAIAAHRISSEWVENRKRQWGPKSSVFINRVLGEFASTEEDSVIPLSWVEMANERWASWAEEGFRGASSALGIDVGRGGDASVISLAFDSMRIKEIRSYDDKDTMAIVGRTQQIQRVYPVMAVVDVIGIGAGVVDRLRELKARVTPFNAAAPALDPWAAKLKSKAGRTDRRLTDRSGELTFLNMRAAAWWYMRELMNPIYGNPVALPPDDLLTGELTAPKYQTVSGGSIKIEDKDDIKKRLDRSTDRADSVIMALIGPRLVRTIVTAMVQAKVKGW